jgi:hypothetical protein
MVQNFGNKPRTAGQGDSAPTQGISELVTKLEHYRAVFRLLDTCKFQYRDLEEATVLAATIAVLFPDPARVRQGLAALMINAVEHGNLGIGGALKEELVQTDRWASEIKRRLNLAENINKTVEVTVTHKSDGTYAVITDQGAGFEWRRYMMVDPSKSGIHSGRGIAQANAASFDKMMYNAKGNQVVVFVNKTDELSW